MKEDNLIIVYLKELNRPDTIIKITQDIEVLFTKYIYENDTQKLKELLENFKDSEGKVWNINLDEVLGLNISKGK